MLPSDQTKTLHVRITLETEGVPPVVLEKDLHAGQIGVLFDGMRQAMRAAQEVLDVA